MSGVYIKGMEMPTSCGECKAFVCYKQWAGDRGDCFCGITKSDAKAKTMNADCPLVPVPPHGRLIDADALVRDNGIKEIPEYYEVVRDAPTIIPAEEGEA